MKRSCEGRHMKEWREEVGTSNRRMKRDGIGFVLR
jgi:hypothetical protein